MRIMGLVRLGVVSCFFAFSSVLAAAEVPPDGLPTGSADRAPAGEAAEEEVPKEPRELEMLITLRPPYAECYPGAPTDRLSIQYAMVDLCKQVGLKYGFGESSEHAEGKERRWVRPTFERVPLKQALAQMLDPHGLTYTVDEATVILKPKDPATAGKPAAGAMPPLPPGVADDPEIRQAIAAVPGATAIERAYNAAMAIARARLAQDAAKIQQEQMKVANGQQALARLRIEGGPLQAEYDRLAAEVREAEEEVRKWEERGDERNGIRYFASWELDLLNKWRQRLAERNARFDPVRRDLEAKQAEYMRQETQLQVAQRTAAALQQEYQAKFNGIVAEVHPKCAALLGVEVEKTAQKIEAQLSAKLGRVFSPGQYTWTANGKEVGRVTFAADGTFRGLGGERGRWEMTEEGVVATLGEWRWLFRAGPADTMLGTGRTEDVVKGVQKAVLRPVKPEKEPKAAPDTPNQPQPPAAEPVAAQG